MQGKLRHAVIGAAASIFSAHLPGLQLPEVDLVALADINEAIGQQRAREHGANFYTDYRQMLAEVRPDVVVVMTPHPLHARLAIDSLQAGSHVLVEKPLAIQVSEADAMIRAAQEHQRLLGVVFQQRFRPEIQTVKRLLAEGRLGAIQRVEMTATWTRPVSYYQQASWRGTWKGEGGGVLMNQAPHNLDLLCYLLTPFLIDISMVHFFCWEW